MTNSVAPRWLCTASARVAVDERHQPGVVEVLVLPVVERVGIEGLQRPLHPLLDRQVRERERSVLRHGLGEEAELVIAEQVGERDRRVAVQVAAARHAQADRRAAGQRHRLEPALRVDVLRHQRVARLRRELDARVRLAEVRGRDGQQGPCRRRST